MTDLLLKSSGPVADQYKVLAGDLVVRLSEIGTANNTLALDCPTRCTRAAARPPPAWSAGGSARCPIYRQR